RPPKRRPPRAHVLRILLRPLALGRRHHGGRVRLARPRLPRRRGGHAARLSRRPGGDAGHVGRHHRPQPGRRSALPPERSAPSRRGRRMSAPVAEERRAVAGPVARALRRAPLVAILLVAAILTMAAGADVLAPHSPIAVRMDVALKPPAFMAG